MNLMDWRKSTPWTPDLGYCANYSSRPPFYDKQKFKVARSRHLNKVFNSFMSCLFSIALAVLGVTEGRGESKRCRIHHEYISLKIILTTGGDCRSLSGTVLDIYYFSREVKSALSPEFWPTN